MSSNATASSPPVGSQSHNTAVEPNAGPAAWVIGGGCAATAAAAVALAAQGTGQTGIAMAVAWAARVAFVFFWLAYAGRAVSVLFGPTFRFMANRGRAFGLAFAAALLVHLALVAMLFEISPQRPIGAAGIAYFGIGALWVYSLRSSRSIR